MLAVTTFTIFLLLLVLKAGRQSICVAVVDEGVVAVSPGESLSPDPQMVIRYIWRGVHLCPICQDKGIDIAKNNHWKSYKKENFLPQLITIWVVPSRHPPH